MPLVDVPPARATRPGPSHAAHPRSSHAVDQDPPLAATDQAQLPAVHQDLSHAADQDQSHAADPDPSHADPDRSPVSDPAPSQADRPAPSRPIGRVLRWLALAVTVALLWPPGLGGWFGGVIVSGHSMQPTLQPGDLAITMRVDHVEVGDVVVFRPETDSRARVIHRVVGVDGEHLLLRGDNNDWNDPFDVGQDDVFGKMILRVPNVGGWLANLAAAPVWGSLLLVGSGWWLLARRAERRAE